MVEPLHIPPGFLQEMVAITSEMDEAAFLRSQIVEIRRRKDLLYAERAEHANTEVQIRLLQELVDEMVKKSGTAPLWMRREAENENAEEAGACRDYDDFSSRLFFVHGNFIRLSLKPGRIFGILYLYPCAIQEVKLFRAGVTI